jgi:hypothetical protein
MRDMSVVYVVLVHGKDPSCYGYGWCPANEMPCSEVRSRGVNIKSDALSDGRLDLRCSCTICCHVDMAFFKQLLQPCLSACEFAKTGGFRPLTDHRSIHKTNFGFVFFSISINFAYALLFFSFAQFSAPFARWSRSMGNKIT